MDDTALDRRYAGEDAFVQRAGQRGQFTIQFVEGCASCADIRLQMSHGVPCNLEVQAVEHDKDDVVLHGGERSAAIDLTQFLRRNEVKSMGGG